MEIYFVMLKCLFTTLINPFSIPHPKTLEECKEGGLEGSDSGEQRHLFYRTCQTSHPSRDPEVRLAR